MSYGDRAFPLPLPKLGEDVSLPGRRARKDLEDPLRIRLREMNDRTRIGGPQPGSEIFHPGPFEPPAPDGIISDRPGYPYVHRIPSRRYPGRPRPK